MRVRVLYFGMLRDIAGKGEETLDTAPGSLGAVFEACSRLYPKLADHASSIVMARNQEFATPATAIVEGDEIAFLPPVSGGSGTEAEQPAFTPLRTECLCEITDPAGHFFALTNAAIDPRDLVARLLGGESGAVITFEGVVRNHTKGRSTRYLEYDCYQPMALRKMGEIGCQIATTHAIDKIAIVHRLGRLEISEASVVIVVTAPHRRAAFDAALEGINRLKKTVPIWKKEFFADGEVWVEGEWEGGIPTARTLSADDPAASQS